ncbi:MAG: catalase [Candidatus Melainabacteria bacterium]|nr:catalase [Candidatus Melainabacteria bacterium]
MSKESSKKQDKSVKIDNSPAIAEQPSNTKIEQLEQFTTDGADQALTSNQGVKIADNQNSLKAGTRGPSLLEDHFLREKLTSFDHERIPERVVHARGVAAHGIFESYGTGPAFCKAGFLAKGVQTPVFTRFSTVAGSRGSSDMARDVRGFAVKFYTQEGIFDLVGNNMPVFFIQDAIKFPDLIHAVKPEPHNEVPQAQSAHDTFWDFVSLSTEATHMVMWVMSDRAIPRSLRMMEGFGVHTFRLIDADGVSRFVKFHWKPVLGSVSILWDEAVKISGKDPDFHRRDLFESIECGDFPEWELGVQVIEEEDEFKFDFDLLDPTKLVPEELVPIQMLGKMTLNRNPENYFAETEQVAFCISHVVPGIDFTNDPLLQGRLFSYLDTQLKRLGGPNFHEIPINKSLAPVHNNNRDGQMRQSIAVVRTSYEPNTTGGGCPFQSGQMKGGFTSFPQETAGPKIRDRSESFFDHFSQATMFYNSQTEPEKQHIAEAFEFELAKCDTPAIRERMIGVLQHVDKNLAKTVATELGIAIPVKITGPLNMQLPADVEADEYQPKDKKPNPATSDALSLIKNLKPGVVSRKVAILVADGFDAAAVKAVLKALEGAGAHGKIVAPKAGMITAADGEQLKVDYRLKTVGSVLFDALFVPGGKESIDALSKEAPAALFVNETYMHCKAIAASGEGVNFIESSLKKGGLPADLPKQIMTAPNGVITSADGVSVAKPFINAMSLHRVWDRALKDAIVV